ncbi:type II toxin-antitoxin system Phd/YefM family antitoxin [Asticcacaulis sp. EMRT-3]|uniref:type II toxin-antitoxin system Phd/YefM family antitoxin n=1 Tax=Asticcacaulis sp. EMRT-3 TaxID=3040349 RepID=UPI0024AF096A|nr:type II toxin-antitoxin system Phd/YefM family antitoxin [Asticcacaulis sp. EMRT-3]MDI7775918.1 type II toxin-antitoxin system Phd/YefM family antitoxin [Asticcacaulis sp. EMRT-3]
MDDASIGAGDFKAKCLKLLDEVAETRRPLIITKHGKPVARLVPMPPKKSLFGLMAGSVVYEGDIISPIDVEWDANK